MPDEIQLRSVNTGLPRYLGMHQGGAVSSAIHKRPVADVFLQLDAENLDGDRQADRHVHGGPDKALYVYSEDNLRAWRAELGGGPFDPGDIGENLTVAGVDESSVCIGDVWRWGEALIEVAQPRSPCFKLALRTGRPEMTRLFEQSGRCGWYMRVLRTGLVPTAGPLLVERRDSDGLTVARAQRLARSSGGTRAELEAAAAHPALASGWRRSLQRRLAGTDTPPQ